MFSKVKLKFFQARIIFWPRSLLAWNPWGSLIRNAIISEPIPRIRTWTSSVRIQLADILALLYKLKWLRGWMAKQVKDGEFISVLCDVFVGVAVVVQVSIVFFCFFCFGGAGWGNGGREFFNRVSRNKGWNQAAGNRRSILFILSSWLSFPVFRVI